jgi:RimJ/RimL family protein N-acetyltransferase
MAAIRGVETLYLHVDVENRGALGLYERAGYSRVPAQDTLHYEFTKSLNLHDGATKGRNHYLLHKNLSEPIWLPVEQSEFEKGVLGIEMSP